jgi:hypothetical protein
MFHLPEHPDKTYSAANRCIFCRDDKVLSDEHIIPFGLGGRWVLPKSSCMECAKKTGAFEQTCQRTMYGHLRMYYSLPTRRKKERPQKLPLKVKLFPDAEWSFVDVDRNIYPFLVTFPILPMPDELTGRITQGERGAKVKQLWIRGASFRDGILPHLQALCAELKVYAIEPGSTFSAPEFFRMLAKIAHTFATAELGIGAFVPFLIPTICDSDTSNCVQYIGGLEKTEPASNRLHELSLSYGRSGIVAVKIRLLAALETPTYFVAVGRKIG